MTDARRQQARHAQHVRMLYSLGDFQLASSAVAFLAECKWGKPLSRVELRRYRCYETTIITAYCRPFTESRGGGPHLTLAMTGAALTPEQKKLHNSLIRLRNKVVAHSDAEMMRMASKTFTMAMKGRDFVFLQTVFDEGLHFTAMSLIAVDELIAVVNGSLFRKLMDEAQSDPDRFNLTKDYLARAAVEA